MVTVTREAARNAGTRDAAARAGVRAVVRSGPTSVGGRTRRRSHRGFAATPTPQDDTSLTGPTTGTP